MECFPLSYEPITTVQLMRNQQAFRQRLSIVYVVKAFGAKLSQNDECHCLPSIGPRKPTNPGSTFDSMVFVSVDNRSFVTRHHVSDILLSEAW